MTGTTSFIEAPSKPPTFTGCSGFASVLPITTAIFLIHYQEDLRYLRCMARSYPTWGQIPWVSFSVPEHQLGHEDRSETAAHKYSEMPRDSSALKSSGQWGFPHLSSPASVQIDLVMIDSLLRLKHLEFIHLPLLWKRNSQSLGTWNVFFLGVLSDNLYWHGTLWLLL